MHFTGSSKIVRMFHKCKSFLKQYKLERYGYRYVLTNVDFQENGKIDLYVMIQSVRKQVLRFTPEEIVLDDALLPEFSPYDIRAITYLLFQQYVPETIESLFIEKQSIIEGQTLFFLKDKVCNHRIEISARKLYQNYALLMQLNKKDIMNVITTAVQEQTLLDIQNMESMCLN